MGLSMKLLHVNFKQMKRKIWYVISSALTKTPIVLSFINFIKDESKYLAGPYRNREEAKLERDKIRQNGARKQPK